MCGIYCFVNCNGETFCGSNYFCAMEQILSNLKHRGPDGFSECRVRVGCSWSATFASSVLWLQGQKPVLQPVVDSNSNVLLWNGDIFGGPLETESSDTHNLSKSLGESGNVLSVLKTIQGPYSLVYFDAKCHQLYFGRDRLGRHSLLWSNDGEGHFIITSVAKRNLLDFKEVPAVGIFKLDMNCQGLDSITLFPWSDISEEEINNMNLTFPLKIEISADAITTPIRPMECSSALEENYILNNFGTNTEDIMEKLQSSDLKNSIDKLLGILRNSVRVRVKKQPGFCKNCIKNAMNHNGDGDVKVSSKSEDLVKSSENESYSIDTPCKHSKVGVLFSGGLDSAILAALAHEFLPLDEPIDLLNVAFEKPKKKVNLSGKQAKKANKLEHSEMNYLVPDRITGWKTLEILKNLFPDRKWNFVEINVAQEELVNERTKNISHLIHPLNTVLDDSLGCALWFASRADGFLRNSDDNLTFYSSPVRILLLGMGADELFGGYRRHRSAFRSKGWLGLREELHIDFTRISSRNLGRDDRIICDHSCQPRLPYLDENVVSYVCSLEPWERCYPIEEFPPGVGDKLLLRLVAWKIGLHYPAKLPKRALQFGSRIADSKEKGSNISDRLFKDEKENCK